MPLCVVPLKLIHGPHVHTVYIVFVLLLHLSASLAGGFLIPFIFTSSKLSIKQIELGFN